MHDKFNVAGFQNKRDIRHSSLKFARLFLLGHYMAVSAYDSSEMQVKAEDLRSSS